MKRKNIIWTVVIVAIIALLAIPKLLPKKDEGKGMAGKAGGQQPWVNIGVYVVKKQGLIHSVQATGNILAAEEAELHCETQGRVMKIYFEEGQEVKKGQLLLKINDADLQAQLKKAIATKKLKEDTEKRNKKMLDKGGISQEAYDIAFTELNSANADIDLIKEQIRRTEVSAPFDGIIGLRNISEGSYLNNAAVISRIQQIDKVKIEFSVPEKYASMIKRGNEIELSVEGYPNLFQAKIYAIEPKIDMLNRNIVVRAICENNQHRLLPGAFAKVTLTLGNNTEAILIPTQSVVPVLKGQKVYLVKGDSAIEQKIEIGTRTDANVEVIKGLQEGDSVIVEGVIQMRKGVKVKVK